MTPQLSVVPPHKLTPPGQERERRVWEVLAQVPDPEIPVLSVVDLGVVRYVRWDTSGNGGGGTDSVSAAGAPAADPSAGLRVGLTPTYSGCPATEVIRAMVREALERAGYRGVVFDEVLTPPWTSDWITDEGRHKLESFGIAPPPQAVSRPKHLLYTPVVKCPRCASAATERVSEFGSTPCKAHYRCTSCLEPFDHFKCI